MIYVDLLVFEDLFMNYIILYGTAILLNRITKFKKIFLSSTIGSMSLIFLFLNINTKLVFIITILFSIFMSLIAFGYHDIVYVLKNITYMYVISIFLSGALHLINTYFLFKSNNSITNIIIYIVIAPIITIMYIKTVKQIKNNYSNYYLVDIYFKDKPKITVNSFLDTGNKLKDPYNYKPIILLSKKITDFIPDKFILVPYNTISDNGLLECFSPEKIYIQKVGYRKRVLIGLVDSINIEGVDCILNQELLGGK